MTTSFASSSRLSFKRPLLEPDLIEFLAVRTSEVEDFLHVGCRIFINFACSTLRGMPSSTR